MDDLKSKFIHLTGSVPAACPEHDVALTRLFVAELATGVLRGDRVFVRTATKTAGEWQ